MSLFSRRSMMVVAGCALVLPLAAGTANAAFDFSGDETDPVDDASASIEGSVTSTDAAGSLESPVGDGTVQAGENGARVEACAAKQRPCAALRATTLPKVENEQLVELETIDAEALAEVSKDGASVMGSMTAQREDLRMSVDASTDGGSFEAETPLGDGSAELDIDGSIAADGPLGNRP